MSTGPTDPGEAGDGRDLRAAEYVLGTLPGSERAALDLERVVDPRTEAAVRAWERRLAPLALAVPAVAPSPGLWAGIARRLPSGGAVNDDRVEGLVRQVRRWRNTALGSGLLAAGLAAFALLPRTGLPTGERYVAVVSRSGELPALIVSVDTAAGTARVRPVRTEVPEGRNLQLWYVGTGQAPKALGLVGGDTRRLSLPDGAAQGEGVFAVSVEPPGGSPTGQPTGPVVYTGPLIRE